MRLWHKNIIADLPRHQLLGQWRECCCMATNIEKRNTPNHILVNKIMNYDITHFVSYSHYIYQEMINRGYKADWNKFSKHFAKEIMDKPIIPMGKLFPDWHNIRYLRQCFYNLEEKFDCGGLSESEWKLCSKHYNTIK